MIKNIGAIKEDAKLKMLYRIGFEQIKHILEQCKYYNISTLGDITGLYYLIKASNPWGEERFFQVVSENEGAKKPVLKISAVITMLKIFQNRIQYSQAEVNTEDYDCTVYDYTIGKDLSEITAGFSDWETDIREVECGSGFAEVAERFNS